MKKQKHMISHTSPNLKAVAGDCKFVALFSLVALMSYTAVAQEVEPLLEVAAENQLTSKQESSSNMFVDALVSAYNSNPQIKASREAVKVSDEGVSQALANFRPTVTATYEAGSQDIAFDDAPEISGDVENRTLFLEQPIFRGGRTLAAFSQTRNLVRAQREQLRGSEQAVMLNAVTAYMDVLQSQSILELSRNNEDVLQEQLRAAEQRFEVGEITRTDVAQAKARLARAKADTVTAQGDLESAVATFERVVGYKLDAVLTVPDLYPVMPTTLDEALAIGDEWNAQLRSAEYQYEAADDNVYQEAGGLLPEVNLRGTISRNEAPNFAGTNSVDIDSVLVNVSIPLYQSGAEYSRVREAKRTAKQRQYDRDDLQEAVREGVIQAWEDWQTSVATIAAQKAQISAAETALEGVKQEQKFGERTVLDVLDAEQELFVARVDLVTAQRDRVVAIYNLVASIGKLTAKDLNLPVEYYDPEEHYDDVKFQLIGF